MNLTLTPIQKTNLKFGSIIGIASFLLMLIEYSVFRNRTVSAGVIEGNGTLLLLAVGISLGIKHRRRTEPNTLLTFRQAMITGLAIALWTALIYSLFSYSYVVFVNPQYVDEMLLRETYKLPQTATTAETVGARLIAEMTYRPMFQLFGKFLGSLFFGLVISSICSLVFTRKRKTQAA